MSFVPSGSKGIIQVLKVQYKTYLTEQQGAESIKENYLELKLRCQSFGLESFCIQYLSGKSTVDLRCYRVIEFEDGYYLIGESEKRLLTSREFFLSIPVDRESDSSKKFRIVFLTKNHQTKYITL